MRRLIQERGNICQVCDSSDPQRGPGATGKKMDGAHLVSRVEIESFGEVAHPFFKDPENIVLLCQKCHCAFDSWVGAMHNTVAGTMTERFKSHRPRFQMWLRKRDRLLLTLISLTSEQE